MNPETAQRAGTSTEGRRPAAAQHASDLSRTLFNAAVGLIAVHVIDDSFVQPQPGTSAGDHLIGGVILLAVLALAGWAYPRVRAGARAAIALSLVFPAVLSGAEAIYYGGKTGLSGDDFTGLLALIAAPVLLGLGVWTLWTSRRLGDNLARRYGRRVLKFVAVFVAAFIVAMPVSIAYVGSHVSRAEVPDAKLGAAHEDVKLETSDGLELEGWYVPSKNRAAVIVFPGRTGAQKQARMLVRHGYGVLLYDRRGEGHSEGDPNSFGWDFDKDIRAGLDFLKQRADVDPGRIGGLGLSVGGEMLLQTAADTKGLAAIVSEGAGARSMAEELDDVSGFNKVGTALTYGVRDLSNSVFQNRLPPENLIELVPKIAPRPIFLIHGGEDDAGHRNPDYFRAAKEPKQIWEAKGGHTDGIAEQPEEYERRVVAFFDDALRR
jgi:dienelactone hydrolase